MNDFLNSFGGYINNAQFGSLPFWAFPICTILFIWLATTISLKIFKRRKKLKTIFVVNRAWIISSLITAGILVGLICLWWSTAYFSQFQVQLSLLLSLFIAMVIPLAALLSLRDYYTAERLKEIASQPKTPSQLDETIVHVKNAYKKIKLAYIIPYAGFLMLLFSLGKGSNIISIVYDNSGSMQVVSADSTTVDLNSNAKDALLETFDKLEDNNEIVFTTLEGLRVNEPFKTTLESIMGVKQSSALKAGRIVSFNNPQEAKQGLQISKDCYGSPVCESIWKTYLFLNETRAGKNYANRLLIVITDGADDVGASLTTTRFFFDDEGFADYFPVNKVFMIDFSDSKATPFRQRFESAGCEIYDVENNKEAYLDALDAALQSFKNSWDLIYWTILILAVLTIVGLLIQPKKII